MDRMARCAFRTRRWTASWKRRRGVGSRRGGDVRHDQVELIIVREVADDAVRHARGFVCLLVVDAWAETSDRGDGGARTNNEIRAVTRRRRGGVGAP